MKNKAEECKKQNSAKAYRPHPVAIPFLNPVCKFCLRKPNEKILHFAYLLSSFFLSCKCIAWKLHGTCTYYTHSTKWLPYYGASSFSGLGHYMSYSWWAMASKLFQKMHSVLSWTLLWILSTYSGHGTHCKTTPGLLNVCVTGRLSTIAFFIYLILKNNLLQRKMPVCI